MKNLFRALGKLAIFAAFVLGAVQLFKKVRAEYYSEIDGHWTRKKMGGMTLVDAYYIPDAEVAQYVADRDLYAKKATEIFEAAGLTVERDFAGGQDGEAILGYNAEGEYIGFVHLDPFDIAQMKEADAKGKLKEFLLER